MNTILVTHTTCMGGSGMSVKWP